MHSVKVIINFIQIKYVQKQLQNQTKILFQSSITRAIAPREMCLTTSSAVGSGVSAVPTSPRRSGSSSERVLLRGRPDPLSNLLLRIAF